VEFLDSRLKTFLLSLSVVEHLLRVLQKHCSLGLGLANINWAAIHAHLGLLGLLNRTIRLPAEDHTFDNSGLFQATTHNRDNPYIVNVKVKRILRQSS